MGGAVQSAQGAQAPPAAPEWDNVGRQGGTPPAKATGRRPGGRAGGGAAPGGLLSGSPGERRSEAESRSNRPLCPSRDQQTDDPPLQARNGPTFDALQGAPQALPEVPSGLDPRYMVRGELPDWVTLPGDLPCEGAWRTWACPEGGELWHRQGRCRKAGCLRDQETWALRGAERAVDVFKRARKAGLKGRLYMPQLRPPWGAVAPTEEALEAFQRDAQLIFRAHGLAGGAVMAHVVGKEAPGKMAPHAHGLGPLAGRRYTPGPVVDIDDPTDRRGDVIWRGMDGWSEGDIRRTLAALRRWKGAYLHFKKVRGRGLWKQALRALNYELGHALRGPGRDTLRWFGALATAHRKAPPKGAWPPPTRGALSRGPEPTCPTHDVKLEEVPNTVPSTGAGRQLPGVMAPLEEWMRPTDRGPPLNAGAGDVGPPNVAVSRWPRKERAAYYRWLRGRADG